MNPFDFGTSGRIANRAIASPCSKRSVVSARTYKVKTTLPVARFPNRSEHLVGSRFGHDER